MRILMLAQFYFPIMGGIERHVHDLSIELVTRGHDVAIVTLWHEGMPEFECDQGVRIYRVQGLLQRAAPLFSDKEGRRPSPPFPDPEVLWALRRIIVQERPDIVHAHNWIVHSFTPLKTWSKAKLVVTLHDSSLICAQHRFMCHGAVCSGPGFLKCLGCATDHYGMVKGAPTTLSNWLWGKVERRSVDIFLPVSRAIAEATKLAKQGVPYRVIPNFIPDDLNGSLDDANPLLEQLPEDYLLFVGDLTYDKGVKLLLRAHVEMGSQIPLVFIGRPVDNFFANVPCNVHVFQNWPHAAIMSAWNRCTIALMPSIVLDACPTVAMEAMAMGRPVIASRIGGLPDIVDDVQSGILVNPGDWRELQQAILCLLNDPVRRERMGEIAKQRVVRFQARTVVPRIEQVYQEVLQS